jgi:hypothetical protein
MRICHAPRVPTPPRPSRHVSRQFLRFRALPAITTDDAERRDARVEEREDDVARCNLAHEFVERIAVAVLVTLWGPQITALDLLAEGLILVDPPIAHRVVPDGGPHRSRRELSRSRNAMESAVARDVAIQLWKRKISRSFNLIGPLEASRCRTPSRTRSPPAASRQPESRNPARGPGSCQRVERDAQLGLRFLAKPTPARPRPSNPRVAGSGAGLPAAAVVNSPKV